MRYIMKQKVFSWTDSFVIRNEQEQEVYQVTGKLFTLGNQFSFEDMAGNQIASIRQKLFSWGPTYEIYHGDKLVAVVKKQLFTFFGCKFTVDIEGPDDLEATGDFLDHEYTFTRAGRPVASVSKQWFSWSDTYGIDIAAGENDALILASAVVIDMCCHEQD